ncbi:stage V sporulation protein D [Brevibacillus agri BAB-2500]|nr:stage V sporulation protein D [Brevibacillus agri BAB-2500]
MRVSNATVRRRIFISLVIGIVLYTALITRLGYVQLIEGPKLAQMADQLLNREIDFKPNRGRILDRNGNELVSNMTVPTVVAVPAQIKDPKETARQLAIILEQKEEDVYQAITKKQMSNDKIPGGKKLPIEKARKIQELNLPGIYLAGDSKRFYPNGSMAAHILGFTGIDNQGLTGLEKIYDPFLKGTEGHISFPSDAKGRVMPGGSEDYVPPVSGMDMYLTIDSAIQSFIERELDQAVVAYQPDDVLAIAMNPKTGEILGWAVVRPSSRTSIKTIRQKCTTAICRSGKRMSQVRPSKSSRSLPL